ncbi:hypothetical protein [Paenibacillus sp. J2TS4]|uniref:hypothetical protein n=1 Tax=Paenibacillus sp. J2TS4 TaxID=2807194 RepID=UPI001B2B58B3|nr:hypothetical protein [Paenibacillus sp. J2TS4]GIP35345.1 hypothetical protein J2TS4_45550 [Paenibacillus sp. J2TS4]
MQSKYLVVFIAIMTLFLLLVGCGKHNTYQDIAGDWELVDNSDSSSCFEEMKFMVDPTSKFSPVSLHEKKENNVVRFLFGVYEYLSQEEIEVSLENPKADPFKMILSRDNNELTVQYEWDSAPLKCSYHLAENET